MANFESSFKVHYSGIWNEDAFTDDVIKQIAAHSKAEKGKKVKLTLNNVGIKFSRSKIFQQQFIEFYPYEHLKAVTKNPCYGSCIMFIFGGREKKYRIIAIKCPSDSNSIYIVNRVSQYQQNYKGGDVELKKRENGNWTLRDRSAHNANMHLREIFNETQTNPGNDDTTKLNGDIHHVPVLDKGKEPVVRTGSYLKKNGAITRGESIVVQSDDHTGEVHVVTDDGIRDAEDMKALMDHVKVADAVSGSRRGSLVGSKPPVDTASTSGPTLLRAIPKTYDARIVTAHPSPYYDQWASHRRVSGDFVLPARLDRKYSSGTGSVRSSMRVQFDSAPVVTVPRKTMSMRIRPVTSPPPHKSSTTTIQRRIEETYARPVIVQQPRRSSAGSFVVAQRSRRPSSIHVMSGNELRVYQHDTDLIL